MTLHIALDEPSFVYYAVVATGDTAPTVAELITTAATDIATADATAAAAATAAATAATTAAAINTTAADTAAATAATTAATAAAAAAAARNAVKGWMHYDAASLAALRERLVRIGGRGLHSFPYQLNLSTSFHRVTQLHS
jgi:hypothetical protein